MRLRALFLVLVLLECEIALFYISVKNKMEKWVINTGTHELGSLIHMAIIEHKKLSLDMAWGPSYENFIPKKIHVR